MELRGRGDAGLRRAHLRGAGVVALVVALYAGAAVVSTWPALRQADDHFLAEGLPSELPGAAAPGDHLQTLWQLWLPGHELWSGGDPVHDRYSFQPEVEPRINFAGWPFGLPFWPLEALLGSVAAWNAFLLLGYVGAGSAVFLWLRSLGLGTGPALVGGLAFALAPYRAVQAGAGHLLGWIAILLPLSLWAWERRWYVASAVMLASIPLSGQVHLALGAIPFFALYALLRGGSRGWALLAPAGAVLAGLTVWWLSIRGSIGEARSFSQVERYSADLADFVSRDPRHGVEAFVLLGWLTPLLAVAALALLHNRLGLVLGLGVAVPCLVALGANLPGFRTLWRHTPGLHSTRVPERLMPIACLAIAALAAFAVSRLHWRAAPLLALLFVALDLRLDVTTVRPSAADEGNRAYAAVTGAPLGRLLELPVRAPDRQEASVYLYYAMQARRQRPAGYSTVAPKEALRVIDELQPCPDVRDLGDLGVRLLAVHGQARCGVPGRLLARDGRIALYEAYIPIAW
jgi:hypothetical protein